VSNLARTLAHQRMDRLVKLVQLDAPLEIVAENAALVIYSRVGGRHWAAAWWMLRRAVWHSWAKALTYLYHVRYRMLGYDPDRYYEENIHDNMR
jgi:hypothetical protein